jgi:hypothetical protein
MSLLLIASSCASGPENGSKDTVQKNRGPFRAALLSRINVGMPKADVIRSIGNPQSVGARKNCEVLHYVDDKGWWQFDYFYVRLMDGKVESYGPETKDQPVTDADPAGKMTR